MCDETSGYLVVLDAGSTHTAIFAFRYDRRTLIPGKFPLIIDSPVTVPELLATFKYRPGLTGFTNNQSGLASSLHTLCMAAKDALLLHNPSVTVKRVPIYLAATAGLRQIASEDRDRIIQSARAYLGSGDAPFSFRRDEQARVLAGEEEGAFGWLALNQLKPLFLQTPTPLWVRWTLEEVQFKSPSCLLRRRS
jgi:Golgi nucleoside diphosphatase